MLSESAVERGPSERIMRREPRALALAATIAIVAPAGAVVAADWEVEVYGGGLFTFPPSGGRVTKPPSGESFQTTTPGAASVRVTSWYFGDGAGLIDHFASDDWLTRDRQSNLASWGTDTWQYYTVVRPLDRVLSSASVGWPLRGLAGLRLGHRLGRRLTAEVDVARGGHAPAFSSAARADIEEARSAFDSAWRRALSSLPGSRVTSQATMLEGGGRQLVASGVINVNLETGDAPKWSRRPPRRRFASYLTLGAGIVSIGGQEASATLVGRYRFTAPSGESGAPFEETDTVTVRSSRTFGTTVVGVVGLGWKQDLSTRSGIRFDARAYLGRNPTRIVVDARPSVTTGSPASVFVARSSAGAIQFVNSSSVMNGGRQSSLSGPALADFETFTGTGILWQLSLTLGVFLRF
jgi:hypothetical protein